MIDYKLKATFLAFGLFVTLTGSIITVEDWQLFSQEERIQLIMTTDDLTEDQRTLLITVLQLEHDDLELQGLVERQAQEARKRVNSKLSPYENEQWRQAAKYFEGSAKAIQNLRFSKKTYEDLQKRYQNTEMDDRVKTAMERTLEDQLFEINERGQVLHDQLVQAFFAVGLVGKYKDQKVNDNGSEDMSLTGILGILTLIVGLVISVVTGAKLVLEYRKSQIELALLRDKVN